jgi:hypothetical protein
MRHEIIYNQPDGSKLKVTVVFYDNDYSGKHSYRLQLIKCLKGKRKFYKPYDEDSYQFRALSMEKRAEQVKNDIIGILGIDNYNDALNQTWEKLKPDFID